MAKQKANTTMKTMSKCPPNSLALYVHKRIIRYVCKFATLRGRITSESTKFVTLKFYNYVIVTSLKSRVLVKKGCILNFGINCNPLRKSTEYAKKFNLIILQILNKTEKKKYFYIFIKTKISF